MNTAPALAAFSSSTVDGANAGAAKRHWLRSISLWRLPYISGGFLVLLICAQTFSASADISKPMLNAQQSATAIIFYAQPQVSQDLWAALSQTLRADLAEGAGEQPNGLVLDKEPILVRGSEDLRGVLFSKVISVKLLGQCDVFSPTEQPALSGPLGWVLLISGEVQPYISIDCTRLAQVLRLKLLCMTREGRRYAMAQAIAQVLIHEWIYIAIQSSSHGTRGVTQAYLSVDELTGAPGSNDLSTSKR